MPLDFGLQFMNNSCKKTECTEAISSKEDVFFGRGDSPRQKSDNILKYVQLWKKYIFALNTKSSAKQSYSQLRFFLFNQKITQFAQINKSVVQNFVVYLCQKDYSPPTTQRYIMSVSSFCSYLVMEDILPVNPCAKIKLPKIIRKLPKYYDKDEQAIILALAKYFGVYYPILIGLRSGLRRSEIRFLRWEHMDFEHRLIHADCIEAHTTKSAKARTIPMHEDLLEMQLFAKKSGYVFPSTRKGHENEPTGERYWQLMLRPIQQYIETNKLPIKEKLLLKYMRSTFGSMAVQSGIHPQKLQRWLGHASVTTTINHYANVGADKYDEEINNI